MVKAIILLGSPGSGKDTQAELLAERYDFFQFRTSKLLRDLFSSKSDDPTIQKEQALYKSGALNTPSFATGLVIKSVEELAPTVKGIIFNGSPRTRYEVERVYPFFEKLFGKDAIRVFFIRVSTEEVIRRNSQRLMCSVCGTPVAAGATYKEGDPCPNGECTGALRQRDLDRPDIIRQRVRVFQEETEPVIQYFRDLHLLTEINGEQTVEKVQKDIIAELESQNR